MNTIKYENIDNIFFVGDVHGDIKSPISKIAQLYGLSNSLIIFLGDCGIGFIKDEAKCLNKVNKILKNSNSYAILVRGNHDNPAAFNICPANKDFLSKYIKSNLRTVCDYTVLEVSGHSNLLKILCIGGAISIDRMYRAEEKSYWKNEDCYVDIKRLSDDDVLSGVDIIASHEAPDFAWPLSKFYSQSYNDSDLNLNWDVAMSRQKLSSVFNMLKAHGVNPKSWYYGHHHMSKFQKIDGCIFYLNDINEIKSISLIDK